MLPLGESGLPLSHKDQLKRGGKQPSHLPEHPSQLLPAPTSPAPRGPGGLGFQLAPSLPRPPASDSSNIAARLLSLCSGGQARAEGRRHQRGKQLPDFRFNCWEER